jgi:hypothetical protein
VAIGPPRLPWSARSPTRCYKIRVISERPRSGLQRRPHSRLASTASASDAIQSLRKEWISRHPRLGLGTSRLSTPKQLAFRTIINELAQREHVPTDQGQDTGVGGNDGGGFDFDSGSSCRRNGMTTESDMHSMEVSAPSGCGKTRSEYQDGPRGEGRDHGQCGWVDRSPVRAGVDPLANGLGRRDRQPLRDQAVGHGAIDPNREVDHGTVASNRHADARQQMSAFGML